MRLLHNSKAVVVLDEHGHAYNKLMELRLDPSIVFPFLMPNSYLNNFCTRCVFAGSNQAKFEGELNGTYRPNLRFIVPFTAPDAELFMQLLGTPPPFPIEDYARWTNFVPREMVRLTDEKVATAYVGNRRVEMFSNLNGMADGLDKSSLKYTNMTGTLEKLFRASSMAMGVQPYSFLDFGYVFRRGGRGEMLVAAPLCYPATLALLDLWRTVSPTATARLVEARNDGAMFEDLVWDALLTRGFSDGGLQLSCRPLDTQLPTEVVTLLLNEYFVSTLEYHNTGAKWVALLEELHCLEARCSKLKVNLLYRCPKNCKGVDFFVFADGKIFAVQTSISTLLGHSDVDTIVRLSEQFNGSGSGISFERYVFITVTPELDKVRLATTLTSLPHVRTVSADEWLGV
jgi:hypothetical protein